MSSTPRGATATVRRRSAGLHVPAVLFLTAAMMLGSLSLGAAEPAVASTTESPPSSGGYRWDARSGSKVVTQHASANGPSASSERSPAAGSEPSATDDLRPPPGPGPFSMNLYRSGDFVHQQTEYWCVAASVQTMINIMEPGPPDRSRRTQRQLHFQGRRLDQDDDAYWRRLMGEERWRKGLHGLGLTDWAELLNANGYGPYEVDRAMSRKQAIRKAARAVRMTGKPAGLVVWRGAHAWVMSGFEATADPAFTNDFKVRKVVIQDPWYPSVSSIWGASRPPDSAVPVKALDEDYLRYDRPRRKHPKRDGRYMLILPTLPPAAERRPTADELLPVADELLPDVDGGAAQPSLGSSSMDAELMQ